MSLIAQISCPKTMLRQFRHPDQERRSTPLFKPVRRSELPERAAEPRSEQELPNKLQPNDPKKNVVS